MLIINGKVLTMAGKNLEGAFRASDAGSSVDKPVFVIFRCVPV